MTEHHLKQGVENTLEPKYEFEANVRSVILLKLISSLIPFYRVEHWHTMANPIYCYDFTNYTCLDEKDYTGWFKLNAKKWAFQEEKCPTTGRLHIQGKFSLIKKLRLETLINESKETPLQGSHFTPSHSKEFSYVMKQPTRTRGPWTDKIEILVEPNEIKNKLLYPFQNSVKENCKDEKELIRLINVIYNPSGNIGKTFLKKYLQFHRIAVAIPPCTEAKHIMAHALAFESRAYIIDLPRDTRVAGKRKNDANGELWRGIEQLKDGNAYDLRHRPQVRDMEFSPHIWVFTNELPPIHILSNDRWNIYMVHPIHKTLIKWNKENEEKVKKCEDTLNNNNNNNLKRQDSIKKRKLEIDTSIKSYDNFDESKEEEINLESVLRKADTVVLEDETSLAKEEAEILARLALIKSKAATSSSSSFKSS